MAESKASLNQKQIFEIVGEKENLLKELIEFLQNNYQPQEKYAYSKKSGWTIFYRKGGKPLLYINLRDGGFTVTVVVGISLSNKVKKVKLSSDTKLMFEKAKQFYDGKWLNFDIEKEEQIEDIKKLLLIKKKPSIINV